MMHLRSAAGAGERTRGCSPCRYGTIIPLSNLGITTYSGRASWLAGCVSACLPDDIRRCPTRLVSTHKLNPTRLGSTKVSLARWLLLISDSTADDARRANDIRFRAHRSNGLKLSFASAECRRCRQQGAAVVLRASQTGWLAGCSLLHMKDIYLYNVTTRCELAPLHFNGKPICCSSPLLPKRYCCRFVSWPLSRSPSSSSMLLPL